MTDYSKIDFSELAAAFADDEVVTHSYVRDIRLPSGKVLALITLDNGRDHTRPSTLGPVTMLQLARQFEQRPDVRFGVTAMCVGLGQGGTVIWENPNHKRYGKGI